ncbi:MAG: hypothetical protein AAGA57_09120 [Planctomycetota bacterium]
MTDGLTCPSCGYDLRGITQPQCPECGQPFVVTTLDGKRAGRPWVKIAAIAIAVFFGFSLLLCVIGGLSTVRTPSVTVQPPAALITPAQPSPAPSP